LEGIQGDSILVHPILFRSLLGSFHQLKEYQVVYDDGNIHLYLVLQNQEDEDAFAQKVESELKKKLDLQKAKRPPIYSHFLEHLPRDPEQNGKIKLVKIVRQNQQKEVQIASA
jgi:hypothetical protein